MKWLVVEDDPAYRHLVTVAAAAADIDATVITAATLSDALSRLDDAQDFDVAILDIELSDAFRGGLRIAEHIRSRGSLTRIVFLSQLLTADGVLGEAVACAPDALIGKHESLEWITEALKRVAAGKRVSSAEFAGYLSGPAAPASLLTISELRILEAVRHYQLPTRRRVGRRAGLNQRVLAALAEPLLLEASGERAPSGWSVRSARKLRAWGGRIHAEAELNERDARQR